ncbi:MAG: outer membrane beta-barrel protein [Bdellovibrionales bacterium]|nr:outer membrane beta-barrel protein [Bdellovibrionales bacterium]
MRHKLHKLAFVVLLVAIVFGGESASAGNKLEVATGFYSLTAKTSKRSGSASNFGVYRAAYGFGFGPQVDIQIGYTLFMSDIIGGDLGFGPDLGLQYFPMTDSGARRFVTDKVSINVNDVLRPFVSAGFHQRQFQSVDSSYAGFSFGGGAEMAWSEDYSLKAEARVTSSSMVQQMRPPTNWTCSSD